MSASRASATRRAPASDKESGVAPPGEPRVILLTGAESGRKNAEAERIVSENVDADFADFDSETLDGNTVSVDRVLSAVSTIPLGARKRVVLVRDTQQMDQEDQKRLAAMLGQIPGKGLLILNTGVPISEDGRMKRQSVVANEISIAVKKLGRVIEFAMPRAEDVRGWILQEAQAIGKSLSGEAISLLSQLPSEDLQRLRSELEKAACHAGDAPTISGADVEATMSRGADDVIFKLCDAIGSRRKQEALAHVSTLFRSGTRADSVAPRALVLLARQVRLLSQFHYLVERSMAGRGAAPPSAEILDLLPTDGAGGMAANPRMRWMADKYAAQSRNFSASELANRLDLLLRADLALKGIAPGGDSPQALLQCLVVALC